MPIVTAATAAATATAIATAKAVEIVTAGEVIAAVGSVLTAVQPLVDKIRKD